MDKVREVMNNKLFMRGLPWFVLTLVGTFILREIVDIRLQYSKTTPHGITTYRNERSPFGAPSTLEEEYEKMRDKMISDNWENKRIPREGE